MKCELTYIFHNCFLLQLPEKIFLFDYPSDQYLNKELNTIILSKIRDTDLYVFSTHSHHDHFNRNTEDLSVYTKNITYLFSEDIVKKNPKFKTLESCYKIKPDQDYRIKDLEVYSFLSNDEGVAFLIKANDLTIYFGGDLANWKWDDLSVQEQRFLVDYFSEVLAKLKDWPIQIAFSNTDARLKNWAGAAQFIETIKPRLFVPMHTFGDTETITKFMNENPYLETEIFKYRNPGDTLVFEF